MQNLIQAIRNRNAVLFVGAGVSMNLGLPSFSGLVRHMAEEVGYDPDVFQSLGDYLVLAEYYKITRGALGALRSWMDVEWHSPDVKIEESMVHQLIVQLAFPIIYTTNYDRWLEKAYEHHDVSYAKIANVGDLARARDDVTQIMKLHGDFDDDETIVLTESSYFERLAFESPLDIKLRADILGRSVLFIGYSLRDINIRYLLYKLQNLWDNAPCRESRPKSYIFLDRPNAVLEAVLEKRGISVIQSQEDDPGKGLEMFLANLADEALGKGTSGAT